MKKILILTMLFFSLLLIACDTFRTYDYHVLNQSDSTLKISYKLNGEFINKNIPPHTNFLIDTFPTNNNKVDLNNNIINRYFDTIDIKYNSNIKLKKDIYERENWDYNTDDKEKNIYTFKVKNNE